VISFFDESGQFTGSFGRNNSNESYQRGIYLELCNGAKHFSRDLKSERIAIKEPRLNMCINGHPIPFVAAYKAETKSYDDGLLHRFYPSCPRPVYMYSEEIMQTQIPQIELSLILFYVYQKNINPILIELSDEAKLQFNSIYDMALFLKGKFNELQYEH
jgi:hypothetical protein